MRLAADELAALLRAHPYVQVERPPVLWDLETTDLEPFVRLLGEMLASGLFHNGGHLASLRLGVANVHVDPAASDPIPAGDLVAVSISCAGPWTDGRWRPGDRETLVNPDLTLALRASGAVYAYSRGLGDTGGITVLYARSPQPAAEPTRAP